MWALINFLVRSTTNIFDPNKVHTYVLYINPERPWLFSRRLWTYLDGNQLFFSFSLILVISLYLVTHRITSEFRTQGSSWNTRSVSRDSIAFATLRESWQVADFHFTQSPDVIHWPFFFSPSATNCMNCSVFNVREILFFFKGFPSRLQN